MISESLETTQVLGQKVGGFRDLHPGALLWDTKTWTSNFMSVEESSLHWENFIDLAWVCNAKLWDFQSIHRLWGWKEEVRSIDMATGRISDSEGSMTVWVYSLHWNNCDGMNTNIFHILKYYIWNPFCWY